MITTRIVIRLMCAAALLPGVASANAADRPWQVYTTAQGGQPFAASRLDAPRAAGQPLETETAVFVDTTRRYQEVFGFGGAITDATAETYAKLEPEAQQAFLKACLDPREGLGYTILRTTIHSSDFSSGSYTYVKDGDRSLASFDIGHDRRYRLPLLRRALDAGKAYGARMRVFASPWSAPAWMKSNGSMLRGGSLLPEYADTWAPSTKPGPTCPSC